MLDVIDEGEQYRVVVVGVFLPGEKAPPPAAGVYRNRVQTWLSVDHKVRAFALPAPVAEPVAVEPVEGKYRMTADRNVEPVENR